MSGSSRYGAHVQLMIDEAQVLLDHAKVGSPWSWSQTMEALNRLEQLIPRIRAEIAVEGVNEDLAELVGELLRWTVRENPNFDTQRVRELTEQLGLEFP